MCGVYVCACKSSYAAVIAGVGFSNYPFSLLSWEIIQSLKLHTYTWNLVDV